MSNQRRKKRKPKSDDNLSDIETLFDLSLPDSLFDDNFPDLSDIDFDMSDFDDFDLSDIDFDNLF